MIAFLTDSGGYNRDGLKTGFWREHSFRSFSYKKERTINLDSLQKIEMSEGALTFFQDYGEYDFAGKKLAYGKGIIVLLKKSPEMEILLTHSVPKWKEGRLGRRFHR